MKNAGLPDQKSLIRNNDWDVLIILDVCRYDTFKQVLPEVDLNGKLKKGLASVGIISASFIGGFYLGFRKG